MLTLVNVNLTYGAIKMPKSKKSGLTISVTDEERAAFKAEMEERGFSSYRDLLVYAVKVLAQSRQISP